MSQPRHLPPKHSAIYKAVLKYARSLHTYVSMFALIALTFFALTGFMLNHPGWFGLDDTHREEKTVTLPAETIEKQDKLSLVEFLRENGVRGAVRPFDWPGEGEPFHVSFKAPAGQADADITLPTGETRLTIETRGLSGLMTRLHTAKEAGPVWQFLLDATAIFLAFVCLSGLILWQSLPKRRTIGAAAFAVSLALIVGAYAWFVP